MGKKWIEGATSFIVRSFLLLDLSSEYFFFGPWQFAFFPFRFCEKKFPNIAKICSEFVLVQLGKNTKLTSKKFFFVNEYQWFLCVITKNTSAKPLKKTFRSVGDLLYNLNVTIVYFPFCWCRHVSTMQLQNKSNCINYGCMYIFYAFLIKLWTNEQRQ